MGAFRSKLLASAIKLPTQMGFNLNKWEELWLKNSDSSDKEIYLAGKFIFDQLERARYNIAELYKMHAPKTNYNQLLKLYCAMSNRDASIVLKGFDLESEPAGSVFSKTTSNNKAENEVTAEEVAIGCVDGLELAISNCIRSLHKKTPIARAMDPLELIVFIEHEANLSQTYCAYQDYWHSILYRDFAIHGLNEKKTIEIIQPLSDKEVAYLISHTRRMRLHATSFISDKLHRVINDFDDCGILSVVGSGKDRRFKVEVVGSKPDAVRYKNADFLFKMAKIIDEFSDDLIDAQHNKSGFTIKECMVVFRNLMFLADSFIERFPSNTEFFNINRLLEFCPTFKKTDLVFSLVEVTGFTHLKIIKIVEFLTFSIEKDSDLWASPLIPIEGNKLSLLTGVASAPMLERVVERWLVKLKVDLKLKGEPFERKVLWYIEVGMDQCLYKEALSYPTSAMITLEDKREQIDLIFRLGHIVVIGEIKSVIATDSSVSFAHLSEILEGAAKQARRKADFFSSDIKACFARLGWTYQESQNYEIVPIIFNSNRVFAGFSFDSVPVLDEKIIQAYFTKGSFPLLSVGHQDVKHIATLEVHSCEREFVDNFLQYIKSPPQTLGDKFSYEYKSVNVLHFGGVERVCFKRLVTKNYSARDMLSKSYPFPVRTIENIEDYLSELAIII